MAISPEDLLNRGIRRAFDGSTTAGLAVEGLAELRKEYMLVPLTAVTDKKGTYEEIHGVGPDDGPDHPSASPGTS